MGSKRVLQWARWGAALLCASTVLTALLDVDTPKGFSGWIGPPGLALLGSAYCVLLVLLLRPRRNAHLLATAMAISLFLDFDNLAALNLFALPFAIRAGRHRPWLWAQVGIVTLQFLFGWLNLADTAQRNLLANAWAADAASLAGALAAGLIQLFAWAAFAYLVGCLVTNLERDRLLLERTNAELRASQTMLAETTRVEERLRISRELHDSVGHYLTSLGLQLEIAGNIGGPPVATPVERARLLVRLLLAEVREAATEWRTEHPDALPAALRQLCTGVTGLRVDLHLPDRLPTAAPGTTHALFRIVQEALTNTIRHSGATTFSVTLRSPANGFHLEIADNGHGAPNLAYGHGLNGILERVRELGGTVHINTTEGFRIQVTIPGAKELAA